MRSFTFSINKLSAAKTSLSNTANSSLTRFDSRLRIGSECLGLVAALTKVR